MTTYNVPEATGTISKRVQKFYGSDDVDSASLGPFEIAADSPKSKRIIV